MVFQVLTDDEQALLMELSRRHRVPENTDTDPLSLIGLVRCRPHEY
ncbi:hypothetical protein [Streptomyces maremycinicus]|nr:hypothetical protein [Streptomyces sp. NBRC 110468]